MVHDDNDPAVLIAGDPDDLARIWLLVDRVSSTDRPTAMSSGHMVCSHGALPPVAWNATVLSSSITESRLTCT